MTVAIVDTGVANLAAVEAAFARLGVETVRVREPREVVASERVVLPGVGSFGAGIAAIDRCGLRRALREHVERGRPLLAICLGLQLLADGSDESPGVSGLGIVAGHIGALRPPLDGGRVKLPLLGWARVDAESGAAHLDSGYAAFANGFALAGQPPGTRAAWTTHGRRFVAAFERDALLACQFHPELSSSYGRAIIERWLGRSPRRADGNRISRCGGSTAVRRVIPCLDIDRGRVVKGVRFVGLRDAGDPVEQAARYVDAGADELVLLDISASHERRRPALETIAAVRRAADIPLTYGGGIGGFDEAGAALDAGADKVAINTSALGDPTLVERIAARLGSQSTVVSIDAKRTGDRWSVYSRGGRIDTGRDAIAWCEEVARRGAGELLVTSIDRDGGRDGADLDLLRAVSRQVPVPVIASGGIGNAAQARDAIEAGADAVLAASIFHDGEITVERFKTELEDEGVEVRR